MLILFLIATNIFWAALLAYEYHTCTLLQRGCEEWMKLAEDRKGMLMALVRQIRTCNLQWDLVERIEDQFGLAGKREREARS